MLNISHHKLNQSMDWSRFRSGERIFRKKHHRALNMFLLGALVVVIIILFLPWTQSVSGQGYLTTLTPDQRPQTVQSPIPGRVEKWYVREGDRVEKGDTILHISEIKNEYFDPELVSRTGQQIKSKEMALEAYAGKGKALEARILALKKERILKLEQARNKLMQNDLKVKSDSMDLAAAETNNEIARRQYDRIETLHAEGLKSTTDLETKRLKLQETAAKLISQKNKWLASQNEALNARMEIDRLEAAYVDKISKAESELFTARSSQFDSEAQVTKLKNAYTNYEIRQGMYYVRAPQRGYINKAIQAGVGETFKEGEALVGIMPADIDMAVETYVAPIDVPLLYRGARVRVWFDGWPSIVFSGWPSVSYGTYGGRVVAIETFISPNGKYRVLVAPDTDEYPWPEELRVGSGAHTISLLDDVPIWFELWRRLNGFPPNYYQTQNGSETPKKR